ncbi:MFS-type transporter SLC18B1-like isoform X2 [Watersipora subatra]|uniref:MFS-type transporter SLC18B1-like isoform X2 n=1 Tax=Watersipora subatra TaxID=2589382 RepID=UPI00355AF86F
MQKDDSDNMEEYERLFTEITESGSTEELPPVKDKHNSMVVIILALIFLSFCIDTLLIPFFPDVALSKGLLLTEVGVVFSAFDFARFVTAPFAGSMFSRCHPKKLFAIGTAAAGAAFISFGITSSINSTTIFLITCIAIMCVAGMGSAMLNVSGTSLLMKASGYESITIVAFVETGNMVGYALGPAFGAFIYQMVGYTYMFCISGACLLILLPVFCCILPKVEEKSKSSSRGFLSFLTIPGLFIMFLSWVTIKLSETCRATELTTFYHISFGTSPASMGILYAIWSLLSAVGIVGLTKFVNKKYAPYLLLTTWIVFIPLCVFLLPSPPVSYIFGGKRYFMLTSIIMGALAFFASAFYIFPFSISLQLARINGYPKNSLHTYGLLTGLMNSGLCLGSTLGPILTGVIVDNIGFELAQTLAASITTLMAILYGSYLLHLKCTNQLSTLFIEENTTADTKNESNKQKETEQIAEACSERMKLCLQEPVVYTKVQLQPDIEPTTKE